MIEISYKHWAHHRNPGNIDDDLNGKIWEQSSKMVEFRGFPSHGADDTGHPELLDDQLEELVTGLL